MRILQVFDLFSPLRGGGTVDIISKLSQGLVGRGHQVTICTSDFELDQNYINLLDNVEVIPYHCWFRLFGFYMIPSTIKVDVQEFDIIHFHCYRSFQNVVLSHYAREHHVPYIIDAHGSAVQLSGFRGGLKKLYDGVFGRQIMNGVSKFVAETSVGANEYEQLGINHNKIAIIHPPFDIGEFGKLPPKGQFKNAYNIKENHIALFMGRINWIKGLDFLVESFQQLCEGKDDVLLVMVGNDDGYGLTLAKKVESLGILSKVLFTGFLFGENKLSALVDADVLIQPSIHEQGARPSFEAILCNTPVIVTRNTGAGKDIEDIDAGYLVDYGDTKGLSNTIEYVIAHPVESQIKTQKAREWIKGNLSLDKQVGKYEKLYKEVVSCS